MWTASFNSVAEPGAPSGVWFFTGLALWVVLVVGFMIGYRSLIVKWVFGSLCVICFALSMLGIVKVVEIQKVGMQEMASDASRQFGVPLTITATPSRSDYFYLATTASQPTVDCRIDYAQHAVRHNGRYKISISCNSPLTHAKR